MQNIEVKEILNNVSNDTNLVIVDNDFTNHKVKEILKGNNDEIILVPNQSNAGRDIVVQDLLQYIDKIEDKTNVFSAKLNDIEHINVENIYYSNELNSIVFSVI